MPSNIKKLSKISNSMYIIDDGAVSYEVHDKAIIKLNLLSTTVNLSDVYDEVLQWNEYYKYYDLILKKYSKGILSVFDAKKHLKSKDCSEEMCEMIISDLIEASILNDDYYTNVMVNSLIDNNKYSANRIKHFFAEQNIYLSDEVFSKLVSCDNDKALFIAKKVASISKNNSKVELRNKVYNKLYGYMFSNSSIEYAISNLEFNDSDALKRAYDKLSRVYDRDKVVKKLVNKGYSFEKIMELEGE